MDASRRSVYVGDEPRRRPSKLHAEGLRPPPLTSGADPPPHPAQHRPARDREKPAAGTSQVGRCLIALLASSRTRTVTAGSWLFPRSVHLTAAPCVSKRGSPCRARGPIRTGRKTQPRADPARVGGDASARLTPADCDERPRLRTVCLYVMRPAATGHGWLVSLPATSHAAPRRVCEPPRRQHV